VWGRGQLLKVICFSLFFNNLMEVRNQETFSDSNAVYVVL
jgi:hypothetical protein